MHVSSLMKKKSVVCSASEFRLRDNSCTTVISQLHARWNLISISLPQPNKKQDSLTSPARLLLFTTVESREEVSELTNAATQMDLSKEIKVITEVLSRAMDSVYYIYHADFDNFEKYHKDGAGEELAESVDFLLCDPLYNTRCQSELEDTSHNVFEQNDMDDLCKLAEKSVKPGSHGHAYCSLLQPFSEWRRQQTLTEEKVDSNDGVGQKDEVRDEKVFEEDQTQLFYIRDSDRYERNPQSQKLNLTSVMKQATDL